MLARRTARLIVSPLQGQMGLGRAAFVLQNTTGGHSRTFSSPFSSSSCSYERYAGGSHAGAWISRSYSSRARQQDQENEHDLSEEDLDEGEDEEIQVIAHTSTTEWNNPLYALAAPLHQLAPPPTKFLYDPDVAASGPRIRTAGQTKLPPAKAASSAKGGKATPAGKKGAAAAAKTAAAAAAAAAAAVVPETPVAKINASSSALLASAPRLPGHKDAIRALSYRFTRSSQTAPRQTSEKQPQLHGQITQAVRTSRSEIVGGNYDRYNTPAVLSAADKITTLPEKDGLNRRVVETAAQAAARNNSLAPEAKSFLVNAVASRLAPRSSARES